MLKWKVIDIVQKQQGAQAGLSPACMWYIIHNIYRHRATTTTNDLFWCLSFKIRGTLLKASLKSINYTYCLLKLEYPLQESNCWVVNMLWSSRYDITLLRITCSMDLCWFGYLSIKHRHTEAFFQSVETKLCHNDACNNAETLWASSLFRRLVANAKDWYFNNWDVRVRTWAQIR